MALNVTASSVARAGMSITDVIGTVAGIGVTLGSVPAARMVARFAANLIPGGGIVIDAIEAAAPFILKASIAGPKISDAIEAGLPIAEAIDKHGPEVMRRIKEIFAVAVNHDPERPEIAMTADDVSDEAAAEFAAGIVFTPGWTNEEQQWHWDRASTNLG